MNLHSIGQYAGVSMWYGLHRLQQAMQTGLIRRTQPAVENGVSRSAVDTIIGRNGIVEPAPRATYAHPFLGAHIDILI